MTERFLGAKNSERKSNAVRGEISQKLVNCFAAHGDSFFICILTYNKSRVHHCIPKTKKSNMVWHTKDETTPVKTKNAFVC